MNDAVGNPVDIGAVVVWRVEDAAKAILEAESYASYVKAQSETALRRMASTHPYDQVEVEDAAIQGQLPASLGKEERVSPVTLRDGGDAVTESLLQEIRKRMSPVGIAVAEARISHLAYSSEIAGAMLRKQAASAVVAARRMVVKGAVSIIEDALGELDEKKIGEPLDPERRAAMISNLLVVLVGDREVTPVINTGTLYPLTRYAARGRPLGPERVPFAAADREGDARCGAAMRDGGLTERQCRNRDASQRSIGAPRHPGKTNGEGRRTEHRVVVPRAERALWRRLCCAYSCEPFFGSAQPSRVQRCCSAPIYMAGPVVCVLGQRWEDHRQV